MGTAVERRGTFDSRAGTGRRKSSGQATPKGPDEDPEEAPADIETDALERGFDESDP